MPEHASESGGAAVGGTDSAREPIGGRLLPVQILREGGGLHFGEAGGPVVQPDAEGAAGGGAKDEIGIMVGVHIAGGKRDGESAWPIEGRGVGRSAGKYCRDRGRAGGGSAQNCDVGPVVAIEVAGGPQGGRLRSGKAGERREGENGEK